LHGTLNLDGKTNSLEDLFNSILDKIEGGGVSKDEEKDATY